LGFLPQHHSLHDCSSPATQDMGDGDPMFDKTAADEQAAAIAV
jgi:hypothetical protein